MLNDEEDFDNLPEEESFNDRIQRAMNEGKKEELNEKYGMNLESYHSKLSPNEEGEWLNHIEEFERQFESAERILIRELIGNPTITPLYQIATEDVEDMLIALLDLLASHNIAVDFIFDDIDEKEAYRFITEELLDEETDDIRIVGMVHHFIYEEFHPNDREDAKQFAEEFLYDLFNRKGDTHIEGMEIPEDMMRFISLGDKELYNSKSKAITRTEYETNIDKFHKRHSIIMAFSLEPKSSKVDGDYADAVIDTIWEALDANTAQIVIHTGKSNLRLKRSPYGGWDVIQANIVGINCL